MTGMAPSESSRQPQESAVLGRAVRHQSAAAKRLAEFLAPCDIQLGGDRPWDIHVHDERFFHRVLLDGTMGLGESYMDGWWDCDTLDEFVFRAHQADPYARVGKWRTALLSLRSHLLNQQTRSRSAAVAKQHYDLGNDLYSAMLDRRMQYTCAYWKDARDLDEAQEHKLHLVCRKLHMRPGMTVLELGSGFGGLAYFMATEYGCRVVAYNISHEQVEYARQLCAGLPVRIENKDYRHAAGEWQQFDRVVSVGLCEHVGYKNYGAFLALARQRLKDGGLFLLHTIGANNTQVTTDAWINKYIFPNGMIPSLRQLSQAMEHGWVVEDLHPFGPYYDPTLMSWWKNFDRAWPMLRARYGDRFYRMWRFYLLGCAGTFRARKLQLWQFVLSKGDIPSYGCVR
jgi:cyclopropane-fatty-acyl-phospholipid synthase